MSGDQSAEARLREALRVNATMRHVEEHYEQFGEFETCPVVTCRDARLALAATPDKSSATLPEQLRRYAEALISGGANASDLRRDLQKAADVIETIAAIRAARTAPSPDWLLSKQCEWAIIEILTKETVAPEWPPTPTRKDIAREILEKLAAMGPVSLSA